MANKGNLRSRYELNSWLAEWLARLILVGLAVEIASVLILNKDKLEGALTIASTALILIGVWGELVFEKRAREAGDGMIAEANERAARLEKEAAEARGRVADIERLTSWRHISDEQEEQVATAIRHMAPEIDLMIGYEGPDPEAWSYSREVQNIFVNAGVTKLRRVSVSSGSVQFGLSLSAAPGINAGFIAGEFKKAKMPMQLVERPPLFWREGVNLYVFVGHKPPPDLEEWVALAADRSTDPHNNTAIRE